MPGEQLTSRSFLDAVQENPNYLIDGKIIKDRRKVLGYSAKDVAKKIKVRYSYYCRMENNLLPFNPESLRKLRILLKCSLEFLDNKSNMPSPDQEEVYNEIEKVLKELSLESLYVILETASSLKNHVEVFK